MENNREQLLDNLDKNAADISEAEQNLDDLDRSLDASDLEDSEKVGSLICYNLPFVRYYRAGNTRWLGFLDALHINKGPD